MALAAGALAACSSSSTTTPKSDASTDASTDVATDKGPTATDAAKDIVADMGVDRPDVGVDRPDVGVDLRDTNQPICTGTAPARAGIANFDDMTDTSFGLLGADPVIGQTYVTDELMPDYSGASWHITGSVNNDKQFFGVWWNCQASPTGGCTLDASKYKGISFTLKGNPGPDGTLGFTLGRAQNDTQAANAMCGTCTVPGDASADAACRGPRVSVGSIPATSATAVKYTYLWGEFAGGVPQASVDPSQITGILWFFHPPAGFVPGTDAGTGDAGGPSYPVDVTLDNIQFEPY